MSDGSVAGAKKLVDLEGWRYGEEYITILSQNTDKLVLKQVFLPFYTVDMIIWWRFLLIIARNELDLESRTKHIPQGRDLIPFLF